MKCNFCGHEVSPNASECPYCHYQFTKEATVLSSNERDSFEGITIEEETGTADGAEVKRDRFEGHTYNEQVPPRVQVKTVGCGWTSILLLLIILCGFLFILPSLLVFAAIGAVVVYILRLFL